MITEDMIARAMSGERVYFLDDQARCFLLWMRGNTIRIVPQEERFCED